MTVSQPSTEIYSVNIPSVTEFSARFQYNYFTPDESVTGVTNVKLSSTKGLNSVDDNFVQYVTTRVPRFVVFDFLPLKLSSIGRMIDDLNVRTTNNTKLPTNLIANNIDKIITEDEFSSYNFVSIQFHDNDLDKKVKSVVSGSMLKESTSLSSRVNVLNALRDNNSNISQNFLSKGLSTSNNDNSLFPSETKKTSFDTKYRQIKNLVTVTERDKVLLKNKYYTRLSTVKFNAQINSKLLHDLVNRTNLDPTSLNASDTISLFQTTKQITSATKKRFGNADESDYKITPPYIDLKIRTTSNISEHSDAIIVGYIIDKFETLPNQKIIQHTPIVIDNPNASMGVDFDIKYGANYSYTIRSIARITVPAIEESTGTTATMQMLVSSPPSSQIYVSTVENLPPPPPAELNFNWDYENDKLLIWWSMPVNPQRDIKRFQVFRRLKIEEPFELIKQYDFDDSEIPYDLLEKAERSLIEQTQSPMTSYIDDDFTKFSKYIYAIASLDAHGLTSNYSAQFEVSFDVFKNKIVKNLISHKGAPKPYPNLYLNQDTFVDTIKTEGYKRAKLYFNPECYRLIDDDDNALEVVSMLQQGTDYKCSFINLDNAKSQIVTVKIDDKRSETKDINLNVGKFIKSNV